jgi:hypothetical protein
MYIIRAIPGACGDIVSAVIDSTNSFLSPNGSIFFLPQRKLLKNPNLELDILPELLTQSAEVYKSLSCQHYTEAIMKYPTITVNVKSDSEFDWCIHRLKLLYPNELFVKENLKKQMEFHSKHTNFKINLLDILNGKLIDSLMKYKIPFTDTELYYKWLSLNTKNFPYNF